MKLKSETKLAPIKPARVPEENLTKYTYYLATNTSFSPHASRAGHCSYLKYKGETFLLIIAYHYIASYPARYAKYLAYKKLKEFIGNGYGANKEYLPYYKNLSPAISPSNLKHHMNAVVSEGKVTTTRSLYLLDKDLNVATRVCAVNADYSNLRTELSYAWQYTDTGKRAETRRYSSELSEKRKRIYGDVYSNMVGGVHMESGIYLRAYKEKMARVLDFNKKPMTPERHYGIELEFYVPHDNLEDLKKDLATSQYANCLTLGNDGSLSNLSGFQDKELKICVPHSIMRDCINFVSDIMDKYKCKVDAKCGMHVHLDARKDVGSISTMFNNLIDQQAGLLELVPMARRDNDYCKKTKRTDYLRGSRYKSINSLSFKKFQTLEVRLHGGTTDAEKIINWITLISAIAYSEVKVTPSRSAKTMIAKYPLLGSQVAFFKKRIELFKTAA